MHPGKVYVGSIVASCEPIMNTQRFCAALSIFCKLHKSQRISQASLCGVSQQ